MAMMNDHLLWFKRAGTNYAFRGYDSYPGGRCVAFKAGGVIRYIPLTTGTGGLLCERIAGGHYTLARMSFVVYVYLYVDIQFSPSVGYRTVFYSWSVTGGGFGEYTSLYVNIYNQSWAWINATSAGFGAYATSSGMGQTTFNAAGSDPASAIPYYYVGTYYAFGGSWSGTGVFNSGGNSGAVYYSSIVISGTV